MSAGPRIAFVFSGQGSQWRGMGRELMAEEEVFRRTLERCDAAFRQHADWSLLSELSAAEPRLDRTDVVQPLLWAMQVALAAQWRSWGIEPAAVVGQSMGEMAAAQVAGALSPEDAAQLVCRQGRLLRHPQARGEMALVALAGEEAQQTLGGYEDRLYIAATAGFPSTVLSGDPAAMAEVLTAVGSRGVFCGRIDVDAACHCPQLDPLRGDLQAAFTGIMPGPATVPFYSTVEVGVCAGPELDAAYWVRNLCQPVRFAAALERLVADGVDVFVEISPHPIMLPAIGLGLAHLGREGTTLASLRRDAERSTITRSLATLRRLGASAGPPAAEASAGAGLRQALATASAARRRRLVESLVADKAGQVLNLASSQVAFDKPLRSQGLDSFMSVDLRNRLETSLELTIPNAVIWNYPTVDLLASYLADALGRQANPAPGPAPPAVRSVSLSALMAEIDQLSDDDAVAALRRR